MQAGAPEDPLESSPGEERHFLIFVAFPVWLHSLLGCFWKGGEICTRWWALFPSNDHRDLKEIRGCASPTKRGRVRNLRSGKGWLGKGTAGPVETLTGAVGFPGCSHCFGLNPLSHCRLPFFTFVKLWVSAFQILGNWGWGVEEEKRTTAF